MTDTFTKEQRSDIMRRVKSRNTSLEMRVRSALHRRGLRYRLNYPLPGKPDVVFVKALLALFIDSCFWHGCPEHGELPAANRDYWERKIGRTVERDKRNAEIYESLEWRMLRVWEHDLKRNFDGTIGMIEQAVKYGLMPGMQYEVWSPFSASAAGQPTKMLEDEKGKSA